MPNYLETPQRTWYDRLYYGAIILINVLRKWGALPSDKIICKMNVKQFQKNHQFVDLYIFGNSELIDLIYK